MSDEARTQYRVIHEHPQVMAPLVVDDIDDAHRTIEIAHKHLGAEVADGLKIQQRTISPWKDME